MLPCYSNSTKISPFLTYVWNYTLACASPTSTTWHWWIVLTKTLVLVQYWLSAFLAVRATVHKRKQKQIQPCYVHLKSTSSSQGDFLCAYEKSDGFLLTKNWIKWLKIVISNTGCDWKMTVNIEIWSSHCHVCNKDRALLFFWLGHCRDHRAELLPRIFLYYSLSELSHWFSQSINTWEWHFHVNWHNVLPSVVIGDPDPSGFIHL